MKSNILFHKFVKLLINKFFDDIQDNLYYVFTYFWSDIKQELENFVTGKGNSSLSKANFAIRERNFKLIEQMNNLKGLLDDCSLKSQSKECKDKIYSEVLGVVNFLDKFLDCEFEEDILQIVTIILNDLKLVPKEYSFALMSMIDKLGAEVNFHFKFEIYHIDFIFSFLKNLRREDYLMYKEKVIKKIF